ncbi:MAG: serine/threonine protein kinase [Nannocystaceae bacterium]
MRRALTTIILTALALGGCATTSLQTPTGFATHHGDRDDRYEYRASDGEGVVLGVRREKNEPRGDLDFWSAAVDVKLRQAGYEALSMDDVASADGLPGRQIRYVLPHQGRELSFWVTLFVTSRSVVIVEAGGDSEFLSAKAEAVEHAIASLHVG